MPMENNDSTSQIHLLCAADLHLGRHVGTSSNNQKPISYTAQAWERLIELCLKGPMPIDALLLAGDLIDKSGLLIEVYGLLKKGLQQLSEKGITVVAIAGNHDALALDALQRSLGLPNFHLLGANGQWERRSFNFRGIPLHIDGLSFTSTAMKNNPLNLKSWPLPPTEEPLLGLLHCDVDAYNSYYAPVERADFHKLPHQAWLLGHIHVPKEIFPKNPLVRYCGSLQGLDISEHGARGAWLVSINSSKEVHVKPLPLAPLRWEQLKLDISAITMPDWEGKLLNAIEEALRQRLADQATMIDRIGVRLTLIGHSEIYRELRRNLVKFQQQEDAGLHLHGRWIPYFVESIKNNASPVRDLQRLAGGSDFVAALARKLLALQQDEKSSEDLYRKLEQSLERDPFLKQCLPAWPSAEECRELYLNQGFELLDELLEQTER